MTFCTVIKFDFVTLRYYISLNTIDDLKSSSVTLFTDKLELRIILLFLSIIFLLTSQKEKCTRINFLLIRTVIIK